MSPTKPRTRNTIILRHPVLYIDIFFTDIEKVLTSMFFIRCSHLYYFSGLAQKKRQHLSLETKAIINYTVRSTIRV
jgi:hypothetical protein